LEIKEHWEKVYRQKPIDQLGWWEEDPSASLQLIQRCELPLQGHILDIGCGASTLADRLLEMGYTRLTLVDISQTALDTLKKRLVIPEGATVKFIQDDITQPEAVWNIPEIDLWHDRAVLHFLVDETDRQMYRKVLHHRVRDGGYVCIAAFSLEGAKKCSGLPVKNYSAQTLAEFLGNTFRLLEWFPYVYYQPSGNPRPYVYTLFQRIPGKQKTENTVD